MTNAQMIAAIEAAIQTDSNLMTLLILMITNNLPSVSTTQLQAMCTALGISTS